MSDLEDLDELADVLWQSEHTVDGRGKSPKAVAARRERYARGRANATRVNLIDNRFHPITLRKFSWEKP